MRVLLAIHLVGVVMWMGSLLALSRVLSFHTREPPSVRPRFSNLERRLDLFAAVPGAVVTLATGALQIALKPDGWFAVSLWLHIKLLLVAGILYLHIALHVRHRGLAREPADQVIPRAFFGISHGLLALLLIAVMLLAEYRT